MVSAEFGTCFLAKYFAVLIIFHSPLGYHRLRAPYTGPSVNIDPDLPRSLNIFLANLFLLGSSVVANDRSPSRLVFAFGSARVDFCTGGAAELLNMFFQPAYRLPMGL